MGLGPVQTAFRLPNYDAEQARPGPATLFSMFIFTQFNRYTLHMKDLRIICMDPDSVFFCVFCAHMKSNSKKRNFGPAVSGLPIILRLFGK